MNHESQRRLARIVSPAHELLGNRQPARGNGFPSREEEKDNPAAIRPSFSSRAAVRALPYALYLPEFSRMGPHRAVCLHLTK